MKKKDFNLSEEQKNRLLQLVADEERKLDAADLDDDALADEEQRLHESIQSLLQDTKAEQAAPDSQSRDDSAAKWEQFEDRLKQQGDDNSGGAEIKPFRQPDKPDQARTFSHRRYQIGAFLAAAALLMLVIYNIPGSRQGTPVGPDEPDFTYKNTEMSPPVDVVCDYRIAWLAGGSGKKLTDAELAMDQMSFRVPAGRPLQILMKCLSHRVYAQAALLTQATGADNKSEIATLAVVKNVALEPNQWNVVIPDSASKWVLESGDGTILLFLTDKKIAEATVLPSSTAQQIGEQDVLEQFEIPIQLESTKAPQ